MGSPTRPAGSRADSLGTRFSTDRLPGELEPIGRRLNDLLGRLETSFERERRFSADLAHELRTPLAELRSLAELAVKWPDARAAETDRDVLAIATQMESIVTRLLAMVRSEHGRMPIAREPVRSGRTVLKGAWQPLVARAAGRRRAGRLARAADIHGLGGPACCCGRSCPTCCRTPSTTVRRAATVTVEARTTDAGFEVHVRNQAPDLSADDVTKLFDRFWRRDAARSDGDHAGLGLSLARSFARAMGGDLSATQEAEQGLRLTLTAP